MSYVRVGDVAPRMLKPSSIPPYGNLHIPPGYNRDGSPSIVVADWHTAPLDDTYPSFPTRPFRGRFVAMPPTASLGGLHVGWAWEQPSQAGEPRAYFKIPNITNSYPWTIIMCYMVDTAAGSNLFGAGLWESGSGVSAHAAGLGRAGGGNLGYAFRDDAGQENDPGNINEFPRGQIGTFGMVSIASGGTPGPGPQSQAHQGFSHGRFDQQNAASRDWIAQIDSMWIGDDFGTLGFGEWPYWILWAYVTPRRLPNAEWFQIQSDPWKLLRPNHQVATTSILTLESSTPASTGYARQFPFNDLDVSFSGNFDMKF